MNCLVSDKLLIAAFINIYFKFSTSGFLADNKATKPYLPDFGLCSIIRAAFYQQETMNIF
jgi:hypothetical protein